MMRLNGKIFACASLFWQCHIAFASETVLQDDSSPTFNAPPSDGAIILFDGTNLDAWASQRDRKWEESDGPADWKILPDGALEVIPGAGSLITKRKFGDCRLHLELRMLGKETNGGVFVMCRYELGVKDSGDEGVAHIGAFENLREPIRSASKAVTNDLDWQSLDVEFTAPRLDDRGKSISSARASVWLNGVKIHDDIELGPRKGAAKRLGDAVVAPLMLQEHGSAYQFRNVWLVERSDVERGVAAYEPKVLEIGTAAPDFDLMGIDGKRYSLADFADKSVLVVIFTTNHCPDAIASYGRMLKMVDDFRDRNVGFVAINGNDPRAVMLSEMRWSRYDDSYESMKIVADEERFNLPYLYDGDTQTTTKAYGAVATPHVFVFDQERRLRYTGRLDSGRRNPKTTVKSEARDAIEALLAGKPVAVDKTRVFGCSTKWSEKRSLVAQDDREWNERPVTVAEVNAEETKGLVGGDGSSLRLINVWSTTCGPCVTEFPKLVETYRRFQNHPFELITISVDSPEDLSQVEEFLSDQHVALARRTERLLKRSGRTTNNLLFNGDDLESLAASLDNEWSGVQPHTLLIAPHGEVLYRQTGAVDFDMLQAAIVKFVRENYLR
jgi:peroxiredoxin